MSKRGWSTSMRVLSAPRNSRLSIRWVCHHEMSSTSSAPSLHCCSGTSQTRTNSSKTLMCTYKKISTPVYLQNKFTDGVKFLVKIIPSDGLIIKVGRQLLKMLPQIWESNTECRESRRLIDEMSTSLVATFQQALSEMIYLTDNHPWSLFGKDRVDADMDPSARCMKFSDDVRSNGECSTFKIIYDMLKLIIKYFFTLYD
jgi:hypothetical protein